MSSISILGTRIDNVTMADALAQVENLLARGGSHYIITPNPEILLRAYRNPALQSILNEASLSLCDGTGAYFAALCMGKRLQGRVTGVDLMQGLCAYAASHNKSVALIGAQEEVRLATEKVLHNFYPELVIFQIDNESGQEVEADIAFVALGSPKQEQWMAREKECGRFKVMVAVGGAFDMFSGKLVRAPKIMRRMGIEWAWRLALEPQRAGRIASAVIIFPYAFFRSWIS